jgi:hypothetical protein
VTCSRPRLDPGQRWASYAPRARPRRTDLDNSDRPPSIETARRQGLELLAEVRAACAAARTHEADRALRLTALLHRVERLGLRLQALDSRELNDLSAALTRAGSLLRAELSR